MAPTLARTIPLVHPTCGWSGRRGRWNRISRDWRNAIPTVSINGTRLYYELNGSGTVPLVFVHGAWQSHSSWDVVAPRMADSYRVLVYDRRGHSSSEAAAPEDGIRDDVADLTALIEHLDLAPAWVIGVSSGGSVTLRLAAERPDLLGGIVAHEPALLSLLAHNEDVAPLLETARTRMAAVVERIAEGDHAGAAEEFVNTVALGPGSWPNLSPDYRQVFVENARTFVDDMNDPDALAFDLDWVDGSPVPALFTLGGQSPPIFGPVIDQLTAVMSNTSKVTFRDAGHVPHRTHPDAYVEAVTGFIEDNSIR